MDWLFIFISLSCVPHVIYCESRVILSSPKIFQFSQQTSLSHDGYQLRNHVYQEFSTKYQVTQCAMECLVSKKCKSFNFGRLTHVCQLNDANHIEYPDDFDSITDADINEYHERDAFSIDKEALGPCHSFPCQNDGQCLDSRSDITGERIYICLCKEGWIGDNCEAEVNSRGWAGWEEWGSCSVSCGNGYQSRRRRCEELETGKELSVSQCYGREEEYQACPYKQCPVWDKWSDWSECSTFTTCGRGFRLRTRQCAHGGTPGVDRYCLGPLNETTVCHGIKCDSMLRLVNVSEFGEGRVEMYHDQSKKWLQICADKWDVPMANVACKQRGFRLGVFQAVTNGQYGEDSDLDTVELSCQGHEWTLQQCHREKRENCINKAAVQCKVKGIWSLWSGWSECSVTCEDGIQTRTRKCNHPPPNFGGLQCPGSNTEQKNCTKRMCPIDGAWEPWTLWSSCSVSCANGTQSRTRTCSGPQHDGKDCVGDYIEVKDCFPKMCPVDGVWQSWSKWTECSATCGYGTRTRNRTCDGPFYDGEPCQGDDSETEVCNAFSCPVDGSWKPWSPWGECDVVCGGGIQGRWRECDDPLHGGADCPGPANQTQACNTHNCPVDGVWIEWTLWTDCSVTCANGTRYRNRTCVEPKYGGKECEGEPLEQEICVTLSCPVDGEWLPWSEWDACNVTCGGGGKRRYRTCIEPQFGGKDCDGPSDELMDCNMQPCPIDGIWGEWSLWSECNQTCGSGTKTRERSCIGPWDGGKECVGDTQEIELCNTQSCAIDGQWEEWSNWTECSQSCGRGTQVRTRQCDGPYFGGEDCKGEATESKLCNPSNCPVNGVWMNWMPWSACDVTCGQGTNIRLRECSGPFNGGLNCTGETTETGSCDAGGCPVDGIFMEWSMWTQCPVTCGGGIQTRNRTCLGPFYNGLQCQGPGYQEIDCQSQPCPVDGEWSLWTQWSRCNVTCGGGQTSRYRICTQAKHGGSNCPGDAEEYDVCNTEPCPVDGVFLAWSSWGACSVTCGPGQRYRNRTCDGPLHGGRNCTGDVDEVEDCNVKECPIDGIWALWSEWEECSTTCGGGSQWRHRYCNGPFFDGMDCVGSYNESQACNTLNCPVDGVWLDWSTWGECDVTCGGGNQVRNRSCEGPYYEGKECEGDDMETRDCNTQNCPVDGEWLPWMKWEPCSVSCGGGNQSRIRYCNGPYYGGEDCVGSDVDTQECNTHPCPVDGVLEAWSAWMECDVTCGGGIQWRNRSCIEPLHGGKACEGEREESQACNTHNCPGKLDGEWKLWSAWSQCNVTCGGGGRYRQRSCEEPLYGGADCEGPAEEEEECNIHPCPVDGVWETWTAWGSCDLSCGGGIQWHERTCDGPYHGGANCSGPGKESQDCNTHPCPEDGVFMAWSEWGSCDVTCGGGSQLRNRTCHGPFHGGKNCEGATEESQVCNSNYCPVDGVWQIWSSWDECSVTCGGGVSVRNRTCHGPFYGGSECEGNDTETKSCSQNACPIPGDWLDWEGWSRCSKTCGGGTRYRLRQCDDDSYGDLTAPCEGSDTDTEDCHTYPCEPYGKTHHSLILFKPMLAIR
ncbi:hypothetical protein FSP39_001055 [Pinctada imbricata]|uniref:Uncharacterized protein n=1 Tax=Pinctada imbricata TaxID=66713 RepID=A0AA89C034_PINIB|nr:hypothetical protein FSP39_001055 [Pinctada imbricata]